MIDFQECPYKKWLITTNQFSYICHSNNKIMAHLHDWTLFVAPNKMIMLLVHLFLHMSGIRAERNHTFA